MGSAAFVCGTLAARVLSTSQTFQVLLILIIMIHSLSLPFPLSSECHINAILGLFGFQVAAFVSMAAAVYMRVFLKDTIICNGSVHLRQPILKAGQDISPPDGESSTSKKIQVFKKIPSLKELIFLLKSR